MSSYSIKSKSGSRVIATCERLEDAEIILRAFGSSNVEICENLSVPLGEIQRAVKDFQEGCRIQEKIDKNKHWEFFEKYLPEDQKEEIKKVYFRGGFKVGDKVIGHSLYNGVYTVDEVCRNGFYWLKDKDGRRVNRREDEIILLPSENT